MRVRLECNFIRYATNALSPVSNLKYTFLVDSFHQEIFRDFLKAKLKKFIQKISKTKKMCQEFIHLAALKSTPLLLYCKILLIRNNCSSNLLASIFQQKTLNYFEDHRNVEHLNTLEILLH